MTDEQKRKIQRMIIQHMENHQLNQKEMATELNIQQSTLSAWLADDPKKGHGIRKNHIQRILHVCSDAISRDVVMIEGNGNNFKSVIAENSIEGFRAGLISELIDSTLEPEALQTVLKIVKNYKKGE